MKFVVDTNVLFSFFKADSFTRNVIVLANCSWLSPERALDELKKHTVELSRKSKLDNIESVLDMLQSSVAFVPVDEYKEHFKTVLPLAKDWSSRDKKEFMDDIDFFALASSISCPIWSNDKLFKKQRAIPVFTTKELSPLLKSFGLL